MKCLAEDCGKEIENKTGRQKFCSDACKMRWHRKHPRKNFATKFDMQILLNEFKSAIQELSNSNGFTERKVDPISKKEELAAYNSTHQNQFTSFETKPAPPKITRSAEQWHELKRGCESAEEWATVKWQIENATNLSAKQKQTIINTP